MSQQLLFEEIPYSKYNLISKDELITLYKGLEKTIKYLQKELKRAKSESKNFKQKNFFIEEEVHRLRKELFGENSEKEKPKSSRPKPKGLSGKKKVQLLSDRYPNAEIIEREIDFAEPPHCKCCGDKMHDSGMTEDSEVLTTIPAKILILKRKRKKYRCGGCHGSLKTAPLEPSIYPGSTYSDDMILDVALSKYLDLIPVERYAQIAARNGVKGIPPNSLIQTTHRLADFVEPVHEMLKEEVGKARILHADETPHKMLEGSSRRNWYLWGFSTKKSSFFEINESRSGDMASKVLDKSNCEFFMSDVYSGYSKAVRKSNELRKKKGFEPIRAIYCNAHSRRKFKESAGNFSKESKFFIWCYRRIYRLYQMEKDGIFFKSNWKSIYMKAMKGRALKLEGSVSSKSSLGKAIGYFLKNFEGLSLFTEVEGLPIDNNSQERLLRSPVVGRKTWYGTHSKRGAKTTAILFSLVESCKLSNVNPREYFRYLVVRVHTRGEFCTPREYAKKMSKPKPIVTS